MSQPIRIGEILIERGVLTEQQVFEILQAQKRHRVPFGVLAERMFDVTIESIEEAWVDQYHRFTGTLDLATLTPDNQALRLINRRQAWQFQIVPIGWEPSGELLVASSTQRLARAVTFAANHFESVVYFRIAESEQLRGFLRTHYPMPEISEEMLETARRYAQSA